MSASSSRRQFLQIATGGALLGLSDLNFVAQLPGVSAAEAQANAALDATAARAAASAASRIIA